MATRRASLPAIRSNRRLQPRKCVPTQPATRPVKCYQTDLRIIDQLHRSLLQAEEDLIEQSPAIAKLLDQVTEIYEQLIGRYIQAFTNVIQQSGWPAEQLPRNRDVFSRFVEPKLLANEKVAYFLIDSLRYELAVELQQELEQMHTIDLHPVSAQLPTITPVGMASLMPQADQKFSMLELADSIVPALDGKAVRNTTERAEWIRSIYGVRYMDLRLQDVVKSGQNLNIPKVVDLLVVRNTEIDLAGETDASFALREIPRTLQKIRVAIQKLSEKGFQVTSSLRPTMASTCALPFAPATKSKSQMATGSSRKTVL